MSQLETAVPTGTWTSDGLHSTIEFAVKHMAVATFRGRIADFSATLETAADGTWRIDAVATPASIATGDGNLDGHLRAPDFFDVERFPEIRLVTRSVERDGDEIRALADLTIRDVTRAVELRGTSEGPASDPYGNTRIGLELTTTIDRTAFGLTWNAPLPGGGLVLANDVKLTGHVELLLQQPQG